MLERGRLVAQGSYDELLDIEPEVPRHGRRRGLSGGIARAMPALRGDPGRDRGGEVRRARRPRRGLGQARLPGARGRPLHRRRRASCRSSTGCTCSRTPGSAPRSTGSSPRASSARSTWTPTCWRSPTSATSSRCSTASTSRWRRTGSATRRCTTASGASRCRPAFPQFNGGLIALRRTPATAAFLAGLEGGGAGDRHRARPDLPARAALGERAPHRHPAGGVQPALDPGRAVLDHRLRRAAASCTARSSTATSTATPGAPTRPPSGSGWSPRRKLPLLIAADRGLARLRGEAPLAPGPADRRAVALRILADLPRRLLGRLRRAVGRTYMR